MKTQALLVLLCVTAVLAGNSGEFKKGNFPDDEKNRHDTCKPLVNHEGCHCSHEKSGSHEGSHGSTEVGGSGSGNHNISSSGSGVEESGSGSGSDWEEGDLCFLLQIFWEFSLELDIQTQLIFQEWINITQITIVEDASLTEFEIIVKLYYSLQDLFDEHIVIKKSIQFKFVGDWGFVCDLEGLVNDIQSEDTEISLEQVITIVGGSCPLFDGLDECAQNASSSDQAAIKALIADLTIIIKGSHSFSHKLVLIFAKFQQYSKQYSNLLKLFRKGHIEGFGILQSFFDLCGVYSRIDNFSFAVGGTVSNCKLIQAMISWYTNTSSGYSVSERSDIKQLSDKCSNYFTTENDTQLRVQFFVENLYQLYLLENWTVSVIYDLQIEGYGSFYQFIYAFIYCENNGVGQGEFTDSTTKATTPSTSTSTPTTTKTSTTPSTTKTSTTTTSTTTTTTTPSGNCATVTSVNTVTANITLLLTAIDNDQKTTHWNDTLIATFKSYKSRIWVISTNSSSSATAVNKFNAIKTVLTGFTTKADFKAIVMAIFIQGWGTIAQYCNCVM